MTYIINTKKEIVLSFFDRIDEVESNDRRHKKINKYIRQKVFIEALLEGAKTITDLEEAVAEKLAIDSLIPEATRNRDLRDLRKQGFQIDLVYKKSHEPEYVLKRTKIDLECYSENIVVILQLLKLGIDLGLLIDENIEKKIIEFSRLLKKNISRLRIEGLRKTLSLNRVDLKLINKAIEKKCAINFKIQQPSHSKVKSITGFPQEIFIQDKYLYLSVKRFIDKSHEYEWREYRLDRLVPIEKSQHIEINYKNLDPCPHEKYQPIYVKIMVFSPLTNFFEAEMYGLKKLDSHKEYDIYEGNIHKPPFRIMKDFLSFLPHIKIIGNKDLAEEFDSILKRSIKPC